MLKRKKNLQFDIEVLQPEFNSISDITTSTSQQLASCSSREARLFIEYKKAIENIALPLNLISIAGCKTLLLATSKEANFENEKYFRFLIGIEVRLFQVKEEICRKAIFLAYFGDGTNLIPLAKKLRVEDRIQQKKSNSLCIDLNKENENVVILFLNRLINYGVSRNASDIHICPKKKGTSLCLRIDGKIYNHEASLCSLDMHKQFINRIKILAALDISENRRPQDGSFRIVNAGIEINIRVSLIPTIYGEKAVLRLLGNMKFLLLCELGFPQSIYEVIKGILRRDQGLILFSGSTGSGKTTSLYASLKELLELDLQIASIEDPVELELQGVSQSAVNNEIGNTFDILLRSVLRQDPDVVAVGELRDSASANTAIQAALTGHLILTSVHAGSVREVFNRLSGLEIKMGDLLLANRLILNQKLIPKLCSKCRVVDLEKSNLLSKKIFRSVGCSECDHFGFKGRFMSVEIFVPHMECVESMEIPTRFSDKNLSNYGYYVSHEEGLNKALQGGIISLEHYYRNMEQSKG